MKGGELIDVIHRDGDLILGVEAGTEYAVNFSIGPSQHEGDIMFYRKSEQTEATLVVLQNKGLEIMEGM